jgi:hypothetical protein
MKMRMILGQAFVAAALAAVVGCQNDRSSRFGNGITARNNNWSTSPGATGSASTGTGSVPYQTGRSGGAGMNTSTTTRNQNSIYGAGTSNPAYGTQGYGQNLSSQNLGTGTSSSSTPGTFPNPYSGTTPSGLGAGGASNLTVDPAPRFPVQGGAQQFPGQAGAQTPASGPATISPTPAGTGSYPGLN